VRKAARKPLRTLLKRHQSKKCPILQSNLLLASLDRLGHDLSNRVAWGVMAKNGYSEIISSIDELAKRGKLSRSKAFAAW